MRKTAIVLVWCGIAIVFPAARVKASPNFQGLPIVRNAQKAIAGELGVRDENDYYVMLANLMRSEALAKDLRLRLAYKVLEGDLPEKGVDMISGRLLGLSRIALFTLGRLEDISAISYLEQKLPLWEKGAEANATEPLQSPRIVPDVLQARITLARLRAVRAVPLRSSRDVRERFHKMLDDLGIPLEEWNALMREAQENPKVFDEALLEVGSERHERFWRARILIKEYAQMLLQARTQGWDVSNLLTEFPLEATDLSRAYAALARLPNATRLQEVVQQALQWHVMNAENAAYAQYLLDHAAHAVPVIIDTVRSLSSTTESSVGVGALAEVLATATVLEYVEPQTVKGLLNESSNQQAHRFAQLVQDQVSRRQVKLFMGSF